MAMVSYYYCSSGWFESVVGSCHFLLVLGWPVAKVENWRMENVEDLENFEKFREVFF